MAHAPLQSRNNVLTVSGGAADMGTRTEADERQRRQLLSAVTGTNGRGTDVRSIVAAANVSISTLYRHYPTKRELFRAAVEETLAPWREQVEQLLAQPCTGIEQALQRFYLAIIERKRAEPDRFARLWDDPTDLDRVLLTEVRTYHGEVVYRLLRDCGRELDDAHAELLAARAGGAARACDDDPGAAASARRRPGAGRPHEPCGARRARPAAGLNRKEEPCPTTRSPSRSTPTPSARCATRSGRGSHTSPPTASSSPPTRATSTAATRPPRRRSPCSPPPLAGCFMTQLRAFSKRLDVPLHDLHVTGRARWIAHLDGPRKPYTTEPLGFELDVAVDSDADDDALVRLAEAAKKGCFIEQTLSRGNEIRHRLLRGDRVIELEGVRT